jgi:NADPH-dependent glutamate synthase beta subunit-like oxidoreductase
MPSGFTHAQAVAEAERCLLCVDAPCSKACPAATDPGRFIRKFRMKNTLGAVRTIKQANILGGACSVLCPTADLCEGACCATGLGAPVRIAELQRYLVEYGWKQGFDPFECAEPTGPAVAVVGAGPAGLACAAELAKAGMKVTVFEARERAGGVLAYGVPEYRFSPSFLARELEDVTRLGIEIRCSTPIDGRNGVDKLLADGFKAVFLGIGCWDPVRLVQDGPDIPGVLPSMSFLSALRDGREAELAPAIKGKTVAVLGGGSVAMDCIGAAARLGAKDVYMVYRRSWAEMPARTDERLETLEVGAHFLLLSRPVGYVTDGSGRLSGLRIMRTRLGAAKPGGRRQPEDVPGSEYILEVDAVVEAFSAQPDADSPSWYPAVKVDDGRLVIVDPGTGATSVPGVYAGGDVVNGPDLVVHAVRDGKRAAKAIQEFLVRSQS